MKNGIPKINTGFGGRAIFSFFEEYSEEYYAERSQMVKQKWSKDASARVAPQDLILISISARQDDFFLTTPSNQ